MRWWCAPSRDHLKEDTGWQKSWHHQMTDHQGRVSTSATDQISLMCKARLCGPAFHSTLMGAEVGKTPCPGELASSSTCLRESHLLWDYPDFCLGGRRGPSAYMLSSPRRVRRHCHSLSHGQKNFAKVTWKFRKCFPSLKDRLLPRTLRQSFHNHWDLQCRRQRPQREPTTAPSRDTGPTSYWALSQHHGCQRAPGRDRFPTGATWKKALGGQVNWGNLSGGKFHHQILKYTFPLTHS